MYCCVEPEWEEVLPIRQLLTNVCTVVTCHATFIKDYSSLEIKIKLVSRYATLNGMGSIILKCQTNFLDSFLLLCLRILQYYVIIPSMKETTMHTSAYYMYKANFLIILYIQHLLTPQIKAYIPIYQHRIFDYIISNLLSNYQSDVI